MEPCVLEHGDRSSVPVVLCPCPNLSDILTNLADRIFRRITVFIVLLYVLKKLPQLVSNEQLVSSSIRDATRVQILGRIGHDLRSPTEKR